MNEQRKQFNTWKKINQNIDDFFQSITKPGGVPWDSSRCSTDAERRSIEPKRRLRFKIAQNSWHDAGQLKVTHKTKTYVCLKSGT